MNAASSQEPVAPAPSRPTVELRWALVVVGLVLSGVMVSRAQLGGDQLNIIARGWLWAAEGEFIPYGNPLSSGGNGPGALTTFLAGAPLFVWMDHRAPVVAIWLSHLAAFLLLDRILARNLSSSERLAFVAIFWLNPWRLEASANLWNPNYLFFAGAVHFATAFGSRERRSFLYSLIHVLTLGLAVQLHPGSLLLIVLTSLLWWRRALIFHWGGVVTGALVSIGSLIPWLLATRSHPEIVAVAEGFPFRGLLYVHPMLKGMFYFARYPSLRLSWQATRFDFSDAFGTTADRWMTPLASWTVTVAGGLTVAAAAAAVWIFLRGETGRAEERPLSRWWVRNSLPNCSGRRWIQDYAGLAFVGALIVFAAAPTTPQHWQAFSIFHATLLPPVFAVGHLERSGHRLLAHRVTMVYATLALIIGCALAIAAPEFRLCRSRDARLSTALALADVRRARDSAHLRVAARPSGQVVAGRSTGSERRGVRTRDRLSVPDAPAFSSLGDPARRASLAGT